VVGTEGFVRSKGGVLDLAVLGLLHESPMHGYELRKRLNTLLGMFRAFSYGSLYPCLKQLVEQGLITEDDQEGVVPRPAATRRSKIVYKLTAEGKERLQDLLSEAGPASWEDEGFGVLTPAPTYGCGFSKAGAADSRNGWTAYAPRWPALGSESTTTRSSSNSTGWSRSSARSGGSTS
jgi:DNA-binding PadR family transcriptional regulator